MTGSQMGQNNPIETNLVEREGEANLSLQSREDNVRKNCGVMDDIDHEATDDETHQETENSRDVSPISSLVPSDETNINKYPKGSKAEYFQSEVSTSVISPTDNETEPSSVKDPSAFSTTHSMNPTASKQYDGTTKEDLSKVILGKHEDDISYGSNASFSKIHPSLRKGLLNAEGTAKRSSHLSAPQSTKNVEKIDDASSSSSSNWSDVSRTESKEKSKPKPSTLQNENRELSKPALSAGSKSENDNTSLSKIHPSLRKGLLNAEGTAKRSSHLSAPQSTNVEKIDDASSSSSSNWSDNSKIESKEKSKPEPSTLQNENRELSKPALSAGSKSENDNTSFSKIHPSLRKGLLNAEGTAKRSSHLSAPQSTKNVEKIDDASSSSSSNWSDNSKIESKEKSKPEPSTLQNENRELSKPALSAGSKSESDNTSLSKIHPSLRKGLLNAEGATKITRVSMMALGTSSRRLLNEDDVPPSANDTLIEVGAGLTRTHNTNSFDMKNDSSALNVEVTKQTGNQKSFNEAKTDNEKHQIPSLTQPKKDHTTNQSHNVKHLNLRQCLKPSESLRFSKRDIQHSNFENGALMNNNRFGGVSRGLVREPSHRGIASKSLRSCMKPQTSSRWSSRNIISKPAVGDQCDSSILSGGSSESNSSVSQSSRLRNPRPSLSKMGSSRFNLMNQSERNHFTYEVYKKKEQIATSSVSDGESAIYGDDESAVYEKSSCVGSVTSGGSNNSSNCFKGDIIEERSDEEDSSSCEDDSDETETNFCRVQDIYKRGKASTDNISLSSNNNLSPSIKRSPARTHIRQGQNNHHTKKPFQSSLPDTEEVDKESSSDEKNAPISPSFSHSSSTSKSPKNKPAHINTSVPHPPNIFSPTLVADEDDDDDVDDRNRQISDEDEDDIGYLAPTPRSSWRAQNGKQDIIAKSIGEENNVKSKENKDTFVSQFEHGSSADKNFLTDTEELEKEIIRLKFELASLQATIDSSSPSPKNLVENVPEKTTDPQEESRPSWFSLSSRRFSENTPPRAVSRRNSWFSSTHVPDQIPEESVSQSEEESKYKKECDELKEQLSKEREMSQGKDMVLSSLQERLVLVTRERDVHEKNHRSSMEEIQNITNHLNETKMGVNEFILSEKYLKEENTSLKTQNRLLYEENGELSETISELTQEVQHYQSSLRSSQRDNDILRAKVDALLTRPANIALSKEQSKRVLNHDQSEETASQKESTREMGPLARMTSRMSVFNSG